MLSDRRSVEVLEAGNDGLNLYTVGDVAFGFSGLDHLIVPTNRTGSCGMMESLDLRSDSLMAQISTSSMKIFPVEGSMRRKRDEANVDLPGKEEPDLDTCAYGVHSSGFYFLSKQYLWITYTA